MNNRSGTNSYTIIILKRNANCLKFVNFMAPACQKIIDRFSNGKTVTKKVVYDFGSKNSNECMSNFNNNLECTCKDALINSSSKMCELNFPRSTFPSKTKGVYKSSCLVNMDVLFSTKLLFTNELECTTTSLYELEGRMCGNDY
jgi:hypothetical protein